MTIALWIIAICEVIRALQNAEDLCICTERSGIRKGGCLKWRVCFPAKRILRNVGRTSDILQLRRRMDVFSAERQDRSGGMNSTITRARTAETAALQKSPAEAECGNACI